jgi:hypothetical protein
MTRKPVGQVLSPANHMFRLRKRELTLGGAAWLAGESACPTSPDLCAR